MAIRNVIFDFDGTLVDTSEGVINGIKHVLRQMDVPIPEDAAIARHIGPPLREMLEELFETKDEARIAQGIKVFRQYYNARGVDESKPYEGVRELLQALDDSGVRTMILTNKPTVFALKILERFSLAPFFEQVVGQELSGAPVEKRELFARMMRDGGFVAKETVLVGDSVGDIDAAKSFGAISVGVTYGYTPGSVLSMAAPDLLCESVEGLRALLLTNDR